jgi:general L-amino acid transport system substrate-binding protein
MAREIDYDLYFPPRWPTTTGKVFMLPRSRNKETALDLNGSKVCVQSGTTTLLNLTDYFRANNMKYEEMKFDKLDDIVKAYDTGKCDAFTVEVSPTPALTLSCPTSSPRSHWHRSSTSATTTG